MKKKIFSILLILVLACSFSLVTAVPALANNVPSSTMIFEGTLTDGGGGVYTGTIPMTTGDYYVLGGGGAGISEDGGFDVYAKTGGVAYVEGYYGTGDWNYDGQTDTFVIDYYGDEHDAYPDEQGGGPWGSWYDPDCADWGMFSLELTADHWYLRYTATMESPMSGVMYWYGDGTGYAAETDPGTVRNDDGSNPTDPLNRDATRYTLGSAQEWGWHCGWGEERIPLAFPGFDVDITEAAGVYTVTLTPAVGDNPAGPVVNEDTGESYGAIQPAIDAPETLDTHTISVAAGTYDGFKVSEKDLTISGIGDPMISGDTVTVDSTNALIGVEGSTVTIEGLTVDATGITALPFAAIFYSSSSGTIQENIVQNIGDLGQDAGAISVQGTGTEAIAILDNVVSEFNKVGIVAKDVLSVQIEDNVVSTTNYNLAPNGIQVGYFDETATTGTVNNNQISGCQWSGYDPGRDYEDLSEPINWTGSGILVIAPNSALEISENEVQNSDVGLDIEAGPLTFMENNDVHDNSYGFVLWNAAPAINFNDIYQNSLCGVYRTYNLEGILKAENNYWGNASGPTHESNPLGTGDEVSNDVDFEPWLLEIDGSSFDKTIALQPDWTLISPDKRTDGSETWIGGATLTLKYTPAGGFVEAFPGDLGPLTAIYIKTVGGGGIGFNYEEVEPGVMYSKELEAGWNLIGIPSMVGGTPDILSPLRYVTIGTQQGIGLTTLVSQGEYNLSGVSFYDATLTDEDWGALPTLDPFDGYWANMEGAETFEVIP